LDQEIVGINKQHQPVLDSHEIIINLMRQELQQYQQAQNERDRDISKLKTMVETLMAQVKGREKRQNQR